MGRGLSGDSPLRLSQCNRSGYRLHWLPLGPEGRLAATGPQGPRWTLDPGPLAPLHAWRPLRASVSSSRNQGTHGSHPPDQGN